MPKVRTYSKPAVARQAMPGVRISTEAPAGAFATPKPIDAKPVLEAATRFFEAEREKADQIAIVDASGKLSAAETEFLFGQNGVMARKGKDVFNATDELNDAWQKTVSEIETGLKGSRQKLAFKRQAMERWESVNRQVMAHVSKETQEYDAERTEAFVFGEREAAIKSWSDPVRIEESIGRQIAAITEFNKRHGSPPEHLERMVSEAVSATHAGVISQMLANDQDLAASAYFQKHKAQINGTVATKLTADMQEGTLRGEAQRITDDIFSKDLSKDERDARVRAIDNPKVRDEVQKRVDQEDDRRYQAQRRKADDLFQRASSLIDAKRTSNPRAAVPPALWNQLEPSQKSALYSYAETVTDTGGGKGGAGAVGKWLDFLELDESELAGLTRSELETKYLQHLGKGERGRAITRWDKARNADPKERTELKSEFTLIQQVSNALDDAGVFEPEDKAEKNAFRQMKARIEREAEALRVRAARAKGKPLTSDEEDAIVDAVVLKHSFQRPTAGSAGEVRRTIVGRVRVIVDDRGPRVPIGQVPDRRKEEIRQRIKAAGGTVTTNRIERAYAAFASGDAALFKSIVAEK